ncbi:alpha/beta hydrolase, partial [Candidatus Binatia bacterium]|nr:alpha/beta hydrolase [Candidatus Binatia bacterium]
MARAAIGGLSLGGDLALAFHGVHPERVAAPLLCDTGPGFREDAARERWNAFASVRAEAFER